MKRIATSITTVLLLLALFYPCGAHTPASATPSDFPSRAYLGVHLTDISKEKAQLLGAENPYGSYITRILPGSAAEKSGLKPLDYVVGIDQHQADEDTEIHDILQIYEAGTEATLHLYRQGKPLDLKIKFGSKSDGDDDARNSSFLGLSPMDEAEEEEDPMVGVAIEVVKGSAAEKMGLQDGDVITAFNGYTMIDWTDVSAIIRSLAPEANVELTIRRNGETLSKTGKMGKQDERNQNWNINLRDLGASWSNQNNLNWNGRYEDQGSGAFLGVNIGSMSKEKAKKLGFTNPYGLYISSVIPNTAAAKAGLQAFDYLYGIDEYRVGEAQSMSFILRKFSPGQKVNVYFIRKGQERTVSLTMGDRDDDDDDEMEINECDKPFLGVSQSHESYNERGVLVNIVEGSTAKEMGLKNGDVVTSINGYPIIDWSDITMALGTLKAGNSTTVEYLRDGKKNNATKAIKSKCDARKSTTYSRNDDDDDDDNSSWSFRSWNQNESRASAQTPRVNPANVKVRMEDMDKADADKMKSLGVNMPAINNLRAEKINVYPNPNKGMFRLQFDLPEKGITEIKVFNAAGRMIYEYELGNFSGEFSDDIDISQNGTGTYFLQIRQGEKFASKKIILQ